MGATAVMNDGDKRISVSEFARKVSSFVATAKDQPITLTKNGEAVAVLVDFESYRELAELEATAEDLYWTVVALRQEIEWAKQGRPTVPLSEVEARARGGN